MFAAAMTMASALERGRQFVGQRAWADAYAELSSANDESALSLDDLPGFALAAYMCGEDNDCADAWMRAHQGMGCGPLAGVSRDRLTSRIVHRDSDHRAVRFTG